MNINASCSGDLIVKNEDETLLEIKDHHACRQLPHICDLIFSGDGPIHIHITIYAHP